jgi:hypothetical protein
MEHRDYQYPGTVPRASGLSALPVEVLEMIRIKQKGQTQDFSAGGKLFYQSILAEKKGLSQTDERIPI